MRISALPRYVSGLILAATLAMGAGLMLAPESVSQDDATPPSAGEMFDAYLDADRAARRAFERIASPGLVEELAHRTERDQAVRQLLLEMLQTPGAGPDEAQFTWLRLFRHMQGIDRDNARWIKQRLEDITWFTISEFGEEADNNAFLIVQHATHDPDFMRDVHRRFETLLPQGEIAPDNYALLTDRLAVMDDVPQPFGSQFECADGEQRLQTPLADPEPIVDARRAEVGLPTMAEYRAMLPDCSSIPGAN